MALKDVKDLQFLITKPNSLNNSKVLLIMSEINDNFKSIITPKSLMLGRLPPNW